MYDGNLSLNSPDYRRKNLESSYRKNATKLSRYRNITREHARHYRGNSLESMELVRFVRGPFTPLVVASFRCGENRSARFSSPFSLRHAPNAATRRIGRRSARDGTGRRKNNRYTTVCAETNGDKLAREKTRRRRRRRRNRVASRGETDVAGVNRLNIFQPENGMGLELATLGKSRTPTFSLRLVWNNNDESSCLFPDTFE